MTGARLCAWADGDAMAVLPHYSPGYPEWDIAEQPALLRAASAPTRSPGTLERARVRHAAAEEIAARRVRRHAARRTRAALDRARALRELLVRDLPVPARAVSPRADSRRVPSTRESRPADHVRRRTRVEYARRCGDGRPSACRSTTADDGIDRRALPLRRHDLHQHGPAARVSLSRDARAPRRGLSDSRAGRARRRPATTGTRYMCEYMSERETADGGDRRGEAACRPAARRRARGGTRPAIAAGCYCEADSRQHKWGLVLETIHYALHDTCRTR